MVSRIEVRGARVHNLRNVDVDIPLNKIVGVAGVSGSGKSSLALGVLYTEGSRRYLEALSTYTRRRLTQAPRADVDEVLHVPAALALHQRPGVPGIRSTFGTGTELLNTIRLMFSRLAFHRCPNGHMVGPTIDVAAEKALVCPVCGAKFFAPGAEDLAFNSGGACRTCDGTGMVRSVDRATLVPDETLSTGERQRMQLARAVRNRTTGVLYVLDEPSIGLHPANVEGLKAVMHDLVADGNTVLLVDHDVDILREADRIIEMGPKAGREGGRVIAEGSVGEIEANSDSMIGPYLSGRPAVVRTKTPRDSLFEHGEILLETKAVHTVKPLSVRIPKGRLTVVTGVSGSGKTTLVLESLLPALRAAIDGTALPAHVGSISAQGIRQAKLIDATPIGVNVRSTVATYANVHDDLRKAFAKTPDAKAAGMKAGDFSYNTGRLRCPECDGTGSISLDVQFLPDVDVPCPACRGSRYAPAAFAIRRAAKAAGAHGTQSAYTLPEFMDMDVSTALRAAADMKTVSARLRVLEDLGLGYLTLGEATPGLSGGEAQRLKLAGEMGRGQDDALFVFDEPTIGLHPENVATLMAVFERLVEAGATVIVIEHDLDVIRAADWMIDLGPGGGDAGGTVVFEGVPEDAPAEPRSVTGRHLGRRA